MQGKQEKLEKFINGLLEYFDLDLLNVLQTLINKKIQELTIQSILN